MRSSMRCKSEMTFAVKKNCFLPDLGLTVIISTVGLRLVTHDSRPLINVPLPFLSTIILKMTKDSVLLS
jgi:hypothetical protein